MDRKILPQFNELVQNVRKLLLNHLAKHVREAFTQADSTLFKCAEKAENNQIQAMFFESIREVRKQHVLIERAFLQNIASHFDDFINGKVIPIENDDISADKLSLVQTDDFEESLLVTSMSKKVSERCIEQLHGIEQRLALINSGKKLGDSSPLAPAVIANSFYHVLANSPFNLQIKTILYMLFEQFVMSELGQFYAETNKLFIESGVLANLKYSASQTRGADTTPIQQTKSTQQPTSAPEQQHHLTQTKANHAAGTEHTASTNPFSLLNNQSSSQQNFSSELSGQNARDESARFQIDSIDSMLTLYRQQQTETLPDGIQSISALVPKNSALQYNVTQLLGSLNQLQKKAAEQAQQQFVMQSVDNIKSNLVDQLKTAHDIDAEHKIPEQHANTIDLVGMLFNFLIEDASLSDTSKAILSNLHSLYLQVALQDKSLFTRHQHPARKLLNSMAQAGVMYCGASEENALQQKMKFTVSQALQSFNGDSALFEYLLQDFKTFVNALKQRIELREKRAVEAAKGHDKLLAARNQARALVENILDRFSPPSIMRIFLTQTWVDVLVFAFLRHGPASQQWQRYAEVAQQLAWSGTALEEDEQKKLDELRLDLLEDLRKGLDLLGSHHPDMIRKLLQDLVACQHAVQARETLIAEQMSPKLPESQLGTMLGEDAVPATPPPANSLSEKAKQFAYQLEHIDFGTWFEFDNPAATLKLSWFSPTTRNYMFVDNSGQRVAIKALTSLALELELEQGSARIITDTRAIPLMDRALNAIQKLLQRFNHKTSIR